MRSAACGHLDLAELRRAAAKAFLLVAIDRTSELVVAPLYRKATKLAAGPAHGCSR